MAVTEAVCVSDACDKIANTKFDAVLVNISLAGENGLEFIENQKQKNSDTIFMIMSGFDIREYRQYVKKIQKKNFLKLNSLHIDEMISVVVSIIDAKKIKSIL